MKPMTQRKEKKFLKDLKKIVAEQTPAQNRALLLELRRLLAAARERAAAKVSTKSN
jgi:hypothetical protein